MATRLSAREAAWLFGETKSQRHVRQHGLDLADCWQRAKRKILEAGGVNPDTVARIAEPVGRARRLAELAATADMRLSLALSLGATPRELDEDLGGARLALEAAHKRLGIVGLRSGEMQLDVSERFRDFLAAWQQKDDSSGGLSPSAPAPPLSQPVALPPDVNEPARRRAPGIESGSPLQAERGAEGCPSAWREKKSG